MRSRSSSRYASDFPADSGFSVGSRPQVFRAPPSASTPTAGGLDDLRALERGGRPALDDGTTLTFERATSQLNAKHRVGKSADSETFSPKAFRNTFLGTTPVADDDVRSRVGAITRDQARSVLWSILERAEHKGLNQTEASRYGVLIAALIARIAKAGAEGVAEVQQLASKLQQFLKDDRKFVGADHRRMTLIEKIADDSMSLGALREREGTKENVHFLAEEKDWWGWARQRSLRASVYFSALASCIPQLDKDAATRAEELCRASLELKVKTISSAISESCARIVLSLPAASRVALYLRLRDSDSKLTETKCWDESRRSIAEAVSELKPEAWREDRFDEAPIYGSLSMLLSDPDKTVRREAFRVLDGCFEASPEARWPELARAMLGGEAARARTLPVEASAKIVATLHKYAELAADDGIRLELLTQRLRAEFRVVSDRRRRLIGCAPLSQSISQAIDLALEKPSVPLVSGIAEVLSDAILSWRVLPPSPPRLEARAVLGAALLRLLPYLGTNLTPDQAGEIRAVFVRDLRVDGADLDLLLERVPEKDRLGAEASVLAFSAETASAPAAQELLITELSPRAVFDSSGGEDRFEDYASKIRSAAKAAQEADFEYVLGRAIKLSQTGAETDSSRAESPPRETARFLRALFALSEHSQLRADAKKFQDSSFDVSADTRYVDERRWELRAVCHALTIEACPDLELRRREAGKYLTRYIACAANRWGGPQMSVSSPGRLISSLPETEWAALLGATTPESASPVAPNVWQFLALRAKDPTVQDLLANLMMSHLRVEGRSVFISRTAWRGVISLVEKWNEPRRNSLLERLETFSRSASAAVAEEVSRFGYHPSAGEVEKLKLEIERLRNSSETTPPHEHD